MNFEAVTQANGMAGRSSGSAFALVGHSGTHTNSDVAQQDDDAGKSTFERTGHPVQSRREQRFLNILRRPSHHTLAMKANHKVGAAARGRGADGGCDSTDSARENAGNSDTDGGADDVDAEFMYGPRPAAAAVDARLARHRVPKTSAQLFRTACSTAVGTPAGAGHGNAAAAYRYVPSPPVHLSGSGTAAAEPFTARLMGIWERRRLRKRSKSPHRRPSIPAAHATAAAGPSAATAGYPRPIISLHGAPPNAALRFGAVGSPAAVSDSTSPHPYSGATGGATAFTPGPAPAGLPLPQLPCHLLNPMASPPGLPVLPPSPRSPRSPPPPPPQQQQQQQQQQLSPGTSGIQPDADPPEFRTPTLRPPRLVPSAPALPPRSQWSPNPREVTPELFAERMHAMHRSRQRALGLEDLLSGLDTDTLWSPPPPPPPPQMLGASMKGQHRRSWGSSSSGSPPPPPQLPPGASMDRQDQRLWGSSSSGSPPPPACTDGFRTPTLRPPAPELNVPAPPPRDQRGPSPGLNAAAFHNGDTRFVGWALVPVYAATAAPPCHGGSGRAPATSELSCNAAEPLSPQPPRPKRADQPQHQQHQSTSWSSSEDEASPAGSPGLYTPEPPPAPEAPTVLHTYGRSAQRCLTRQPPAVQPDQEQIVERQSWSSTDDEALPADSAGFHTPQRQPLRSAANAPALPHTCGRPAQRRLPRASPAGQREQEGREKEWWSSTDDEASPTGSAGFVTPKPRPALPAADATAVPQLPGRSELPYSRRPQPGAPRLPQEQQQEQEPRAGSWDTSDDEASAGACTDGFHTPKRQPLLPAPTGPVHPPIGGQPVRLPSPPPGRTAQHAWGTSAAPPLVGTTAFRTPDVRPAVPQPDNPSALPPSNQWAAPGANVPYALWQLAGLTGAPQFGIGQQVLMSAAAPRRGVLGKRSFDAVGHSGGGCGGASCCCADMDRHQLPQPQPQLQGHSVPCLYHAAHQPRYSSCCCYFRGSQQQQQRAYGVRAADPATPRSFPTRSRAGAAAPGVPQPQPCGCAHDEDFRRVRRRVEACPPPLGAAAASTAAAAAALPTALPEPHTVQPTASGTDSWAEEDPVLLDAEVCGWFQADGAMLMPMQAAQEAAGGLADVPSGLGVVGGGEAVEGAVEVVWEALLKRDDGADNQQQEQERDEEQLLMLQSMEVEEWFGAW